MRADIYSNQVSIDSRGLNDHFPSASLGRSHPRQASCHPLSILLTNWPNQLAFENSQFPINDSSRKGFAKVLMGDMWPHPHEQKRLEQITWVQRGRCIWRGKDERGIRSRWHQKVEVRERTFSSGLNIFASACPSTDKLIPYIIKREVSLYIYKKKLCLVGIWYRW